MRFFLILLSAAAALSAQTITWTDIKQADIEGQGWRDTKAPFDRMPAKAEKTIRPAVWSLSRNSAGLRLRFTTASPAIHARWTVMKESLALPHMPATGVSGLDLYVKQDGVWRWIANGRPEKKTNEQALVQNYKGPIREYLLYLPLYNGIESISVGVPEGAKLEILPPDTRKPVLFYGTSILQGGCASRPGMVYTSIIGRRLDYPTINLGFSGNALSEPEIAQLLAELDPAVYVYDSLPNLGTVAMVNERTEPFLRTIRKAHPTTPIILIENVIYTQSEAVSSRPEQAREKNRALRAIYEKLKAEGDRNLYYVPGANLLGLDGEGTVDGSHPTDLGFLRMADEIGPVVGQVIARTLDAHR
ncbi:MAG: SGNH/GDSL hydrolase family protein [Acidobacteria bacterium]|nr:SGNH/GDSL hydrolase family protein [Acidobacteriota bacterium]